MHNNLKQTLLITAALAATALPLRAAQIGDLARIKGGEQSKLIGMGLVVGLKGTGDGGKFAPAMEPLAEVIRRTINANTVATALKNSKNVALVSIEATTPAAGIREGDRIDVYVSAIGSAKSLKGGRLLVMPLVGPHKNDSIIYAYASGDVTLEDPEAPTTGTIRNGAQLVVDIHAKFIKDGKMTLVLKDANATFQMAQTISGTINALPGMSRIAKVIDPKNVVVRIPPSELADPVPLIAEIIISYIDPSIIETGARVRINEKTGTIVMSGDVQISPVTVQHGGLTITMITPAPKLTPEAPRVEQQHTVGLDPERRGGAKLADLVAAFNQLKVGINDRIAIIKEIHSMGKLHADLAFE